MEMVLKYLKFFYFHPYNMSDSLKISRSKKIHFQNEEMTPNIFALAFTII